MAELDKKIQKAQTDLVQAVLEAQERKNTERVDMLITNAIKQLKMSRFKPDQTTCISLTYLAKVKPIVFSQSNAIKDVLKSLLRRDSGPTNIKGKNDTILPLLAANILLACCDCLEIRTIILTKIEHWLGTTQKLTELMQHLLATLCMKCQGDQQTINSLIDLRHHWLQYLEDNYNIYGPVASDLCIGIRNLLDNETSCDSSIAYLKFLIIHDTDIEGLSDDIARFIIERPISLDSMRKDSKTGIQLNKLILKVFIKLIAHLKINQKDSEFKISGNSEQIVKNEIKEETVTEENKNDITNTETNTIVKNEHLKMEKTNGHIHDQYYKSNTKLYIDLPNCDGYTVISRVTIEAIFTFLSMLEVDENLKQEFNDLISNLIYQNKGHKIVQIFEDSTFNTPYDIPDRLRQKLIHSSLDLLVEFALRNANTNQLMNLLQQFGSTVLTINKILEKIESIKDLRLIKSEIKDIKYFNQLIQFYTQMGATGAEQFLERINQTFE